MSAQDKVEHWVTLVVRPPINGERHGRVRPICSCGWQGLSARSREDARLEGMEHVAQWGVLGALGERRS